MSAPNKRRRTADNPDQWSSLRQVWNASALAEQVAELTEHVAELTEANAALRSQLLGAKIALTDTKRGHKHALAQNKVCQTTVEDLRQQLRCKDVELAEGAAALEQSTAEAASLRQKLASVQEELAQTTLQSGVQQKESERQAKEFKARAKTWRARYEALVEKGAHALASKTVAQYGVTPDEVALYKNFAQKQAEAARAAEEARSIAMKAAHMNRALQQNTNLQLDDS